MPVPWPQFLVPLLPLLALGAAYALTSLAERVARARTGLADGLAVLALVGTLAVLLYGSRSFHGDRRLVFAYAGLVAALNVPLLGCLPFGAQRGQRGAGARLSVAMCALALAVPLYRVVDRVRWRDTAVRQQFEALHARSGPDDAVLGGWSAPTMFRPHAYRYFFLHPGMLAALDDAAKGPAVLRVLQERPPRWVVRDDATRGLSPEVNLYIDAHYRPIGIGDLWERQADRD